MEARWLISFFITGSMCCVAAWRPWRRSLDAATLPEGSRRLLRVLYWVLCGCFALTALIAAPLWHPESKAWYLASYRGLFLGVAALSVFDMAALGLVATPPVMARLKRPDQFRRVATTIQCVIVAPGLLLIVWGFITFLLSR